MKRRRHLLPHMRNRSLARTIRKVRERHAMEPPNGAGNNHLAALLDVLLRIARLEQRQERRDRVVHAADVDVEGVVEGGRVRVPHLLLQRRELHPRAKDLRPAELRPADARVGDEQVDVADLGGDVCHEPGEVFLGGGVALQGDDVAVLLRVGSVSVLN